MRKQHGDAGEPLAQALEALDRRRYAVGGQPHPDRHSWARLRQAASGLRAPEAR